MDRERPSAAEYRVGLDGVFGAEVDVASGGVVGADFEQHQVECAMTFADLVILLRQRRVGAVKHRVYRPLEVKRRPCGRWRSSSVRPEKCCDGVAAMETPLASRVIVSHHSSSVMRSTGMSHASKCAPTPSDVMKRTRSRRTARRNSSVNRVVSCLGHDTTVPACRRPPSVTRRYGCGCQLDSR